MVSKEVLAKFLKLSTDRIKSGLDSKKWTGESYEAALTVLSKRGQDISQYVERETPKEEVTAVVEPSVLPENVRKLSTMISQELAYGEKEMLNYIDTLTENVENLSSLPSEVIDDAIKHISERRLERKAEKDIADRQAKRNSHTKLNITLTPEKQKIADDILTRTDLTKKQKLLEMWNQGLTRSETLSLHFMDSTYIYDLYRETL